MAGNCGPSAGCYRKRKAGGPSSDKLWLISADGGEPIFTGLAIPRLGSRVKLNGNRQAPWGCEQQTELWGILPPQMKSITDQHGFNGSKADPIRCFLKMRYSSV